MTNISQKDLAFSKNNGVKYSNNGEKIPKLRIIGTVILFQNSDKHQNKIFFSKFCSLSVLI
jgi:hypothetical protein